MTKKSAGILMYRWVADGLEVLLVHPGGPLWSRRDLGAWSIPKGEIGLGEEPEASAKREFAEELGFRLKATCLLSVKFDNEAGRPSSPLPCRANSISRLCAATRSRSNGPHAAEGSNRVRKWTARDGSTCRPHPKRSLTASGHSLSALMIFVVHAGPTDTFDPPKTTMRIEGNSCP